MIARLPKFTKIICVFLAWRELRQVFLSDTCGTTILAVRPVPSENPQFSDAQLAQQEAFTTATGYAKVAKDNPIYVQLAKGTESTSYNLAVADWFGKPEILSVNTDGWTGGIGHTIRIRAQDDTRVASVQVTIHSDGNVLEVGEAVAHRPMVCCGPT